MSTDELQIAPWSIVPDIIKILEKDYPNSIPACRYLELYASYITKGVPGIDAFLLTPGGKVDEYGTFVFCAAGHRYNLVIYSLMPDLDKFRSLIANTKLIDWSKYPVWGPIHEKFYPMLNKVFKEKNVRKYFKDFEGNMYFMDKELGKKLEFSCPPEVYIDQLKEEEAELVDSCWPYRGGNSVEVARFMIKHNGGIGLYEKGTNQLIAWVLIGMQNGGAQLYVLDKYKRKGYGTLVAKAATKFIADRDAHPIAFINVDNTASQNLIKKVGYEKMQKVYWCSATSVP